MEDIYLLVDYKGHFGSKHGAVPYRSGLVRDKLAASFDDRGYRASFTNFCDVDFRKENFKNRLVMYTSAEDYSLHYKSFIEDIVLGLELGGARVIPAYKFLRAHHNKVFMEILRDLIPENSAKSLGSRFFGTLEELRARIGTVELPSVIKPSAGSMSKGVMLCRSRTELLRSASRVSASGHWPVDAWDIGRKIRRKGYVRESRHRRKFLAQSFLPGLEEDWKVLIYGTKYYVLNRKARKDDFRASGSGSFSFAPKVPETILDFAETVFRQLNVPHASLDIAVERGSPYLLEFQVIYFGTLTIEQSPHHFTRVAKTWARVDGPSDLEEEFARSVVEYLRH